MGRKVTGEEMHSMLSEVDLNKNGRIELSEFLEVCLFVHI